MVNVSGFMGSVECRFCRFWTHTWDTRPIWASFARQSETSKGLLKKLTFSVEWWTFPSSIGSVECRFCRFWTRAWDISVSFLSESGRAGGILKKLTFWVRSLVYTLSVEWLEFPGSIGSVECRFCRFWTHTRDTRPIWASFARQSETSKGEAGGLLKKLTFVGHVVGSCTQCWVVNVSECHWECGMSFLSILDTYLRHTTISASFDSSRLSILGICRRYFEKLTSRARALVHAISVEWWTFSGVVGSVECRFCRFWTHTWDTRPISGFVRPTVWDLVYGG